MMPTERKSKFLKLAEERHWEGSDEFGNGPPLDRCKIASEFLDEATEEPADAFNLIWYAEDAVRDGGKYPDWAYKLWKDRFRVLLKRAETFGEELMEFHESMRKFEIKHGIIQEKTNV